MHHEKACQATAAAKARAAKKMAAKEVPKVEEKKEVVKEKKEVVKKEVSPELKEKRLESLAKARAVRAARKAESSDKVEERTIASEIKKKVSK